MIAMLDVEVHDALHADLPDPPVLDPHIMARTLSNYVPHPNPIIGIDNFRFAVDKAIRHDRTLDIERQVAMLTIEAVTLQLPYIREGLIADAHML